VLIGGQLHNDVRTLPSAAQLSTFNASRARTPRPRSTPAASSHGTARRTATSQPARRPRNSRPRTARRPRRRASSCRSEIDDRQKQLDEADRLSAEANAKSAQADAIRSGRARAGAGRTSATATDTTETFGHGDNQYPLSHFDGMTDEQVLEVPGVGEATLKDIRKAQKKANRQ
jgi:hypothetical protein